MRSRLAWRRGGAALGLYASVALGIAAMVVAARVLGPAGFGIFATAMAAAGFFQTLLDLTVEESLTKYGFRFVAREEWGKLRRLFRRALQLKLAGGLAAGLALLALAPLAGWIFGSDDLWAPVLAAAALPLVQAPENVGATALLLRGRYDLRGAYTAFAMALRFAAIAVGTQYGVWQAIALVVAAQAVATAAVSSVGLLALRRFPRAPEVALAGERGELRSFVLGSSLATGIVSLRATLAPLVLGAVAGTTSLGLFRVAQAPQTGLTAASSPVRLVLLTEQTREWERGREGAVMAGVRRYSMLAAALMAVAVPIFFVVMPWLVETVFGDDYTGAIDAARIVLFAGAVQVVLGWSKSLPTTVGRPRLRVLTHGIEAAVLLPLVAILGATWEVTGAAVAVLLSTLAFAAAWAVVLARLHVDVASLAARPRPGGAAAS